MEPIRGRTSIEDHGLALRVESVLKRRNSSNMSLENADFKELFFEEHRQRLELAQQNQILKIRLRRLNQAKYRGGAYLCTKCLSNDVPERADPIISELKSFSELIDQRMGRMFSSMKSVTGATQAHRPNELDIIENLSVFGVREETIVNGNPDDIDEGKIVMSVRPTSQVEEIAAKFVFPSGMAVKRIPEDKVIQKVTEMMTKSYSSQNSFLLSLRPDQNRIKNLSEESKKLLNVINPSYRLFCVCIGTYDFTYMGRYSPNSQCYSLTDIAQGQHHANSSLRANSSVEVQKGSDLSGMVPVHEVGMTQRVYCITSYFPFFTFFEDLILSILNIVKVQRLEIYKHEIKDVKKIDSHFQIHRIKQIYEESISKFNRNLVRLNKQYTLKLLNVQIAIKTPLDQVQSLLIQEWALQVLSIFTVDTFVELLTLFLLEDKLVFVCDNSHILTFAIYLFVEYLYRPFVYAFESVYIAPSEEYLNAPMPVVYGILKKKKWMDENRIIEKYQNTYAVLTPAGCNIIYTESRKDMLKRRPEKLKSILTPFFRDIEKRRKLAQKQSKSSEDYVYHSSNQEKPISSNIVQCCNRYLFQEVFRHIPSKEQMVQLRKSLEKKEPPKNKDPHTYVMDGIIANLIEQRKPRDPFFEQILLTQTLNVFISKRCGYN